MTTPRKRAATSAAGKKGHAAQLARHGVEQMREWGRRGGHPTREEAAARAWEQMPPKVRERLLRLAGTEAPTQGGMAD